MVSLEELDAIISQKKKKITRRRILTPEEKYALFMVSLEKKKLAKKEATVLLRELEIPSTIDPHEAIWYINAVQTLKFLVIQLDSVDIKALIKEAYYILSHNTDAPEKGNFRKSVIHLADFNYVPPLPDNIEKLLNEYCKIYRENIHPVIKALRLNYEFVKIWPYSEGTIILGGLLMGAILIKNGYPLPAFTQKDRKNYIAYLIDAIKGKEEKFKEFIIERILNTVNSRK